MSSGQGQRLYFGNLDPNVTQQELEREVQRHGTTANVWVARNPAGFAFVEFIDIRDAEECLKALHDTRLGDRNVKIEFAKNKGANRLPPGLSPALAKPDGLSPALAKSAADPKPPAGIEVARAAPAAPAVPAAPDAAGASPPAGPKLRHRAILKNLPATFTFQELKVKQRVEPAVFVVALSQWQPSAPGGSKQSRGSD